MIATTNVAAKIAAVVAGLGLVASSFAFATPAQAQSTTDLQAQINALLAQIAALQGGSASASMTFTMDLTLGSSGAEVTALQNWLISKGYSIPAGATGYFGAQTQSALAAFQAANGITPAAGYFGPITRAKVNAMGGGSTGGSTGGGSSSGDLEGGAGEIGDAEFVSSLSNEEVGEGDEDVEVAGLEIEADGSDIELTAVSLTFDEGSGSTDDFEDYAEEISIWFDGEEVARVDATDFEDDNDWNDTISLDNGVVIREGDTGELVVAVSAQSNLDNDQTGDEWDVAFESVRFMDAQGATITDDSTGDIDNTIPAGTTSRTFSFESFATAADVELHISTGDDETNDSRTITIDANDDTNDVELLSFMMEAEGDSDLEIKDLGVNFDVTGESHVDDVVAGGTNPAIRLLIDGEEYGDSTYEDDGDDTDVGTDEDVLFEDVDFILDAGEEVEVIIVVDLLSTGDGLAEGSTIAVNVGETETDQTTLWDVEDESGEDLTDTEMTGAASSDAHSLFESGIVVEAVSTDREVNEAEDTGTFTIVVDITAFGEDQYIHELATTGATSTDAGFYLDVFKGGVATSTNFASSTAVTTTADDDGEYFVIDEGTTERFTITVTVNPDAAGLYSVELDEVRFDPDNAADSASTDDTFYSVPSTEDTETAPIQVDAS